MLEFIIAIFLAFFIITTLMGFILGGFISYLLLRHLNKNYEILSGGKRLASVIMGSFFWGLSILSILSGFEQSVTLTTSFLGLSLLAIPSIYCFDKASQLKKEKLEAISGELELERERRIKAERFEREQLAKGLVKFVDRHGDEKWGSPSQVRKWKKIDMELKDDFAGLSPKEFEKFIANLFRKMGFRVRITPYVKDYGADIIAERGKDRVLVQVKKYKKGHHVGAQDVQRTLGAMWKHKANKSILITTSDFTIEAEEQAKEAPIELWNRGLLYRMIDRYLLSSKPVHESATHKGTLETNKEVLGNLLKCGDCGREILEEELTRCWNCKKLYCKDCMRKGRAGLCLTCTEEEEEGELMEELTLLEEGR